MRLLSFLSDITHRHHLSARSVSLLLPQSIKMNRVHSTSIILGIIASLGGLTFACSHLGQTHSSRDFGVQTNLSSSTLTAKEESIAFLKQGAEKALKGDYPGAILEYNQSRRLNPNNPEVYYNRGVAYYYLGKQQQALQDFNQTIQLDPKFAEAYGNRGELLLQKGDKQGAVEDFRQAAKMFAQKGDKESAQQMNEFIHRLLNEAG